MLKIFLMKPGTRLAHKSLWDLTSEN